MGDAVTALPMAVPCQDSSAMQQEYGGLGHSGGRQSIVCMYNPQEHVSLPSPGPVRPVGGGVPPAAHQCWGHQ